MSERFTGRNHLSMLGEERGVVTRQVGYEPSHRAGRIVRWLHGKAIQYRWLMPVYGDYATVRYIDPSESDLLEAIWKAINEQRDRDVDNLYVVLGKDTYKEMMSHADWRSGPVAIREPSPDREPYRVGFTTFGIDTYFYPWVKGYAVLPYPKRLPREHDGY